MVHNINIKKIHCSYTYLFFSQGVQMLEVLMLWASSGNAPKVKAGTGDYCNYPWGSIHDDLNFSFYIYSYNNRPNKKGRLK